LHTAHTNKEQAYEQALQMINLYKDFINYFLCIPVLVGEKTIGERFAGAENTFTCEAIMQDGQMLQCATSHYLGENFAKPYDIKYQTNNNNFAYIHQTSAGASTRLIGGIIMSHADDKGLVLPIGIAPIQIAILPILANKEPRVNEISKSISNELEKYRLEIDNSDNGMGFKLANQEVKGTPICIVIGPNDVKNNSVTLIRRDDGIKQIIKLDNLSKTIKEQLEIYQKNIYNKALTRLNESIIKVNNIQEFNDAIKNKKIVLASWGGDIEDEKRLKQETGASPRCIFKNISGESNKCFYTNKQATHIVYFARAY
jgi:prolyl-tRNA synthetase